MNGELIFSKISRSAARQIHVAKLTLSFDHEVALADHALVEHFESEGHVHFVLLFYKVDLPEGTTAAHPHELEVVFAYFLLRLEQVLSSFTLRVLLCLQRTVLALAVRSGIYVNHTNREGVR